MELPKRKNNRLKGYDYSQNGLYFITICVKDKHEILWEHNPVVGTTCGRPNGCGRPNKCKHPSNIGSILSEYACYQQDVCLSEYGEIIENEIYQIHTHYNGCVSIDRFVIMPNHIHMIIRINDVCINGRQPKYEHQQKNEQSQINGRPQVVPTVSRVIQQFKGVVTKKVGFSIWQKSFHDHIIRNDKEYENISRYIYENPIKWEQDCYYKANENTKTEVSK